MRKISLMLMAFCVAGPGMASAAPQQLYGKSVVVGWSEDRSQRINGEATARNVTRFAQFSIYVSSAGKPFSRMTMMASGDRGGMRTGNRDAVGSEGRRNVSFSGNTINAVMQLDGGARNVAINVDGGSCSARVIMGKESGSGSIRSISPINGNHVEILSVKTSDASCKIQDGNVFGE